MEVLPSAELSLSIPCFCMQMLTATHLMKLQMLNKPRPWAGACCGRSCPQLIIILSGEMHLAKFSQRMPPSAVMRRLLLSRRQHAILVTRQGSLANISRHMESATC